MNPIAQALALGYSAPKVLSFLSKAFPSLAPRIKQAQLAGYSVDKILKLLDRGMGGSGDFESMTESQIHKARDESQNQLGKDLLKLAGTAGGAYLASQSIPGITSASPPPAPQLGGMPPPPPSSQNAPINPIGPNPMANAPVAGPKVPPPAPTNIGQAAQAIPTPKEQLMNKFSALPEGQPGEPIDPSYPVPEDKPMQSDVEKSFPHLDKKVMSLLETGTPDQAYEAVKKSPLLSPLVRRYEESQGRSFLDRIKEMDAERAGRSAQQEVKKPVKGDLVFDPKSGISGDIKDIKNKEALIDSDGKLHKVKVEDVITSPLPKKDMADLFDDLNKSIEEETGEEVSRAVRMLAYHPETNTLLFIPWQGVPYAYDDIDEQEREFLQTHLQKRRTTGENLIGAWAEGTKSVMGSKMFDFIKGLQDKRGGRGNEYSAKFDVIYDPHKHAIEAKKMKMRKRK